MDVPFPSDVYLANGKIGAVPGVDAVFTQGAEYLTHELSKLDGFSRAALAIFYVDDPSAPLDDNGNIAAAAIDPATLPVNEAACVADGSSVFLVDLAATDPASARVACRAEIHTETAGKGRALVAVGPAQGLLLQEGHAYAAVLTSRVKDASGRAVGASADFLAVTGEPYASSLTKVKAVLAGALASGQGDG